MISLLSKDIFIVEIRSYIQYLPEIVVHSHYELDFLIILSKQVSTLQILSFPILCFLLFSGKAIKALRRKCLLSVRKCEKNTIKERKK